MCMCVHNVMCTLLKMFRLHPLNIDVGKRKKYHRPVVISRSRWIFVSCAPTAGVYYIHNAILCGTILLYYVVMNRCIDATHALYRYIVYYYMYLLCVYFYFKNKAILLLLIGPNHTYCVPIYYYIHVNVYIIV